MALSPLGVLESVSIDQSNLEFWLKGMVRAQKPWDNIPGRKKHPLAPVGVRTRDLVSREPAMTDQVFS